MSTLLTEDKIKFLRKMLALTKDVPGDIIEAGVFKGGSLYYLCVDSFGWDKEVYGYDTFMGLPDLGTYDNKKAHHKGDFKNTSMEEVRDNLDGFSANLIQGYFPDSIMNDEISFVHLDMDLYDPTQQALFELVPYLNEKAIVVLDDYKFKNCPGIELAVNDVVKAKWYKIVDENPFQVALMRNI